MSMDSSGKIIWAKHCEIQQANVKAIAGSHPPLPHISPPTIGQSLSVPPSLPSSLPPSLPPSLPSSLPPSLPPFLPPSLPPSLPPFLSPSLPPSRVRYCSEGRRASASDGEGHGQL